jgi:hypothetical protein
MTIEQTIEIPANGWFHLDLPPELAGTNGKIVIIAPAAPTGVEAAPRRLTEQQWSAIEKCRGLAKRLGSRLSSDDFLEQRRKDRELEDQRDTP